ncbi:MAG TPA: response regulator, partial [Rheinheimera sp.]|uniref:response regulator n=1 Tax=Rheinheimera sp. TaxID=1869214 RepID=UPI002F9513B9
MTRLLLIDDDVQLTGLLAEYLTKDGLDVTVHNSAMSGLACLRQSSFDLLILDVMMPVMDGITLLREVRHSSSIPVIMLTARGDDLDKVVGLE